MVGGQQEGRGLGPVRKKGRCAESHSNRPDNDAQDPEESWTRLYIDLAQPPHDRQVLAQMRNRNRRLTDNLRCQHWSGDGEGGGGLRLSPDGRQIWRDEDAGKAN